MKSPISVSAMAASLLISSTVLAGGGDGKGNGGISVVCRDAQHRVTSAELLDLYEAKNDPTLGLSIPEYPNSTEAAEFRRIVSWLRGFDSSEIQGRVFDLEYFNRSIRSRVKAITNSDVAIPLPSDFTPRVEPKKCRIEAAAKYLANGQILLDQEIYRKMNATHQAALWVHEALYKADRVDHGATNSDAVRLEVGRIFAGRDFIDAKESSKDRVVIRNYEGDQIDVRFGFKGMTQFSESPEAMYSITSLGGPEGSVPYFEGIVAHLTTLGATARVESCSRTEGGCGILLQIRKHYCRLSDQIFYLSTSTRFKKEGRQQLELDFNRTKEIGIGLEIRTLPRLR